MSEYNDIDSPPSSSSASLGSLLNTDIVTLLAAHVDYHTMLSILAANPSNTYLIRGLYSHHSSFWHLRIGVHTGKIALSAGPWSPKLQHDALIHRSGHLVHMRRQVDHIAHIKAAIHTERIVLRGWLEWLDDAPGGPGSDPIRVCSYVILGDDGIVRIMVWDVAWRDRELLNKAMTFTDRNGELEGDMVPRIRVMLQLDLGLACLDYEGRLWIYNAVWHTTTHNTQFVEIALPPQLGDTRISYIASAYTYSHDAHTVNGINDEGAVDNVLRITLMDDGSEHLLYLSTRHERIVPIVVSVPEEAIALAYPSNAASKGWGAPDGQWDRSVNNWVDESALYPRTPHLIIPDMDNVPVEYIDVEQTDHHAQRSIVTRVAIDSDPSFRIGGDYIVHRAVLLPFEPAILPSDVTSQDVISIHTKWAAEKIEGYDRNTYVVRIPILPHWVLGGLHYSAWGLVLAKLFPSMTSGRADPSGKGSDVYIKTTVSEFNWQCSILLGDGTRVWVDYRPANIGGSILVPSHSPTINDLPGIWVDVGAVIYDDDMNEYGIAV